ncbi:transposase [Microbacterium sp.]|uniref:transposase n=1 Tax=Microbacterium sp. TaxID=51671 RepID=UPI0025CDEFBC|nr:transposase [Microbacterium sp.]
MPGPYPDEFRQRALRMFSEARPDHKTDHAAIKHVAAKLGVNPETLRLWKKRLYAANVYFDVLHLTQQPFANGISGKR